MGAYEQADEELFINMRFRGRASPPRAIIDSQSVKSAESKGDVHVDPHGYLMNERSVGFKAICCLVIDVIVRTAVTKGRLRNACQVAKHRKISLSPKDFENLETTLSPSRLGRHARICLT